MVKLWEITGLATTVKTERIQEVEETGLYPVAVLVRPQPLRRSAVQVAPAEAIWRTDQARYLD